MSFRNRLRVFPSAKISDSDSKSENLQNRRAEVLGHYAQFKEFARIKRDRLEEARQFQYFKRDADELEIWILEKLQTASEESFRDPTNLQAKIQKHEAFEAEVHAHSNAIAQLDKTGNDMIQHQHFASDIIKKRLNELHSLWDQLFFKLKDKGIKLQQALKLLQFIRQCDEVLYWIRDKEAFVTAEDFGQDLEHVEKRLNELHSLWDQLFFKLKDKGIKLQQALKLLQFIRQCDEVLYWIRDKEAFVTAEDFGQDLEHVEFFETEMKYFQVLQRKFEEFLKELGNHHYRITEVNQAADKLIEEGHTEHETINKKKDEVNEAWHRLNTLAATRREGLFGAHQVQRFNRDIDETLAWIGEKDATLSTDDYGRDLNNVQALQRKHEGTERDLAALDAKMNSLSNEAERLAQVHPDRADAIMAKMNEAKEQWGALKRKAQARKDGLDRSYNLHRFLADYRDLCSWINDMKAVISADELAKDVAGAEALLESHQEHRAETWMTKQEAFLANDDLGDSLDSVESLIKKHEDFEKSLAAQEEKINALDEFATKLIQGQHYAADDVARRRASLLDRRRQLMKKVSLFLLLCSCGFTGPDQ
ncbi:unnamed protein product [Gongylonema pulchrum]|uniref:Spectrin alpha chain n=1 Tax=Gongylonema pulchrum TaxID=637853 RepID=A0A183E333_9BILA|nr:unnamed protein product [Gongylonema pulchrum]